MSKRNLAVETIKKALIGQTTGKGKPYVDVDVASLRPVVQREDGSLLTLSKSPRAFKALLTLVGKQVVAFRYGGAPVTATVTDVSQDGVFSLDTGEQFKASRVAAVAGTPEAAEVLAENAAERPGAVRSPAPESRGCGGSCAHEADGTNEDAGLAAWKAAVAADKTTLGLEDFEEELDIDREDWISAVNDGDTELGFAEFIKTR